MDYGAVKNDDVEIETDLGQQPPDLEFQDFVATEEAPRRSPNSTTPPSKAYLWSLHFYSQYFDVRHTASGASMYGCNCTARELSGHHGQ